MQTPPVWITGVAQTGPVPQDPRSIPEMVLEVVEAAQADAGIDFPDVDAIVTASVDLYDGLTASNVAVTEVVGAVMKPETRIAGDGLAAAIHAACQIRAGAYRTVLVVAHGKASMASQRALGQWTLDPIYVQPLGVDPLICAGLSARALADEDPGAERVWAQLAARRRGVTVDEIMATPLVAAPLREAMCAPDADGACAVVLSAESSSGAPRLIGIGHDLAPHSLGDRSLTDWDGLGRACDRAYADAGIDDPARAFDLAEPSCRYPHEEDLFVRAARIDTEVPRSNDGGLFSGAIPAAAGLTRLAAAARTMRADSTHKRALAHGTWGPVGQAHAVAVLEAGA